VGQSNCSISTNLSINYSHWYSSSDTIFHSFLLHSKCR